MNKFVAILGAMAACFVISLGPARALAQDITAGTDGASLYRIGTGDALNIRVFGEDDLSGEYQVDGTGNISMPLIGQVGAAGLTLRAFEQRVTDMYSGDYLINPRVSVEVLNFSPFYIYGEVNEPGSYEFVEGMRAIQAITIAGGYTPRARRNDFTIQRGPATSRAEFRGTEATVVLPGDVIQVRERLF